MTAGNLERQRLPSGDIVISVVDDDEAIRLSIARLLRSVGYAVETFASAELLLDSGSVQDNACLILDIRMPGIDGFELQRRLNSRASRVPIIFVTSHDSSVNQRQAMEGGAVGFFRKPFDVTAFLALVQAVAVNRGVETFTDAGSVRTSARPDKEDCGLPRPRG